METAKMRNSITMVLLMMMSTFAVMEFPEAKASEVVLTDAIQIVNGGSANDRMVAVDADSMGNVHFVWSRNTQHLWYQMHNPRGDVLIAETQISNPGRTGRGIPISGWIMTTTYTSHGPTKLASGQSSTLC